MKKFPSILFVFSLLFMLTACSSSAAPSQESSGQTTSPSSQQDSVSVSTNPDAYVEANLIGFYNILEACRHSYDEGHTPVEHLVYASSSSVYGSNKKVPYSTDDKVDNPVSLYAATKKSNELMAHAYSKLYNIPSTGLREVTPKS